MLYNGYIKLDRNLLTKNIFRNEKMLKIWIWCILKAQHEEADILLGLQTIHLNPGQFCTGRFSAAEELGMSPSTVWRYLRKLDSNESIKIESNNKFSVITVLNWEYYQIQKYRTKNETEMLSKVDTKMDNKKVPQNALFPRVEGGLHGGGVDSKMDNKWTTNGQQMDTNNNVNNDKNDNNKRSIYSPAIAEIISYLNEKADRHYSRESKSARKYITRRLNEGHQVEEFKRVIDIKVADWLGTEQDKYLRPETLFGEKFESYLNQKMPVKKKLSVQETLKMIEEA